MTTPFLWDRNRAWKVNSPHFETGLKWIILLSGYIYILCGKAFSEESLVEICGSIVLAWKRHVHKASSRSTCIRASLKQIITLSISIDPVRLSDCETISSLSWGSCKGMQFPHALLQEQLLSL